jgi:hypothetical protein
MKNKCYDEIVDVVLGVFPKSKIALVNKGTHPNAGLMLYCPHVQANGQSSVITSNGHGRCVRCNAMVPPLFTSKFSWTSIKEYFRVWWKRAVVDEYPYGDGF